MILDIIYNLCISLLKGTRFNKSNSLANKQKIKLKFITINSNDGHLYLVQEDFPAFLQSLITEIKNNVFYKVYANIQLI